jgi:hypothetical protein
MTTKEWLKQVSSKVAQCHILSMEVVVSIMHVIKWQRFKDTTYASFPKTSNSGETTVGSVVRLLACAMSLSQF